jgi:hypothetical protein
MTRYPAAAAPLICCKALAEGQAAAKSIQMRNFFPHHLKNFFAAISVRPPRPLAGVQVGIG